MFPSKSHTQRRLSTLVSDPFVRAAFERAERDDGAVYAVPIPNSPVLTGGETQEPESEMEVA